MNFRPGSNVADLSLHKDGGIDRFDGFERFLVWRTFCSNGSAERSKAMASKPALAASTALQAGRKSDFGQLATDRTMIGLVAQEFQLNNSLR